MLFSFASLNMPRSFMQTIAPTISRIYHTEWISGAVLFIARTRATAGDAADSSQMNRS